jgi:PTS system cellobiose-specific IIA component
LYYKNLRDFQDRYFSLTDFFTLSHLKNRIEDLNITCYSKVDEVKTMSDESRSVQFAAMTILHAGNARKYISDAYKELSEFHFEAARKKIEQARKETLFAHQEQSKIIQAESDGESLDFSLLLTHAQDTLMSAVSEMYIAKNLINIVEKIQESHQNH